MRVGARVRDRVRGTGRARARGQGSGVRGRVGVRGEQARHRGEGGLVLRAQQHAQLRHGAAVPWW